MKHLIGLLVCLMFILSISAVYAAPVGNIATTAMLKSAIISKDNPDAQAGIIAAGEFDITFDRKLKDQRVDTEFNFYGGKAGVVFADKAFIYGLAGAANFESEFLDQGMILHIESETDFMWGVGASIILYEMTLTEFENSILRFGVDGRYRQMEPDYDKIIIDGTSYNMPDAAFSNLELEYKDWQVAGAVSLQWGQFSPYLGIKYSDADGKARATAFGVTTDKSLEADDNFGMFIGADIVLIDSISVNVEGRFIDEEALSLGCAIRF